MNRPPSPSACTKASHPLLNLWKSRALLGQFVHRNVQLRHKGNHLGFVWSILNPLMLLSLYVFVFGYIFRGSFQAGPSESRIEYGLTVFLGLAIYHFVAEVISVSPSVIVGSPNFVKKVVFPLEILPGATVGAAAFHFAVSLTLVFLGCFLAGLPIAGTALWLPIILVPLFMILLGGGLLFAALGVFWRDLTNVTQFLLLLLMFASGVFYPVSQIPSAAWTVLKFNPLLHVINEARSVIFWGHSPDWLRVGYLYIVGFLTIAIGTTLFKRMRASFADVL